MNDAAARTKFRNMLYECGFDCFVVAGYLGQRSLVIRQQRGEADRKLIDNLIRELAEGLDAEESEVWKDSEGYE